jgi:hypothetical protein
MKERGGHWTGYVPSRAYRMKPRHFAYIAAELFALATPVKRSWPCSPPQPLVGSLPRPESARGCAPVTRASPLSLSRVGVS